MAKRKPGFTEGKSPITVNMRSDLAGLLAERALKDRRTQSACVDLFIENYLSNKTLEPMPEGTKIHRSMAGTGEAKIRRYTIEPKTVRLLQEAESLGYSQSYILEEAVKEGISS